MKGIFGLFQRNEKLVLAEADERMEYFGNQAYSATRAEAREARKHGDRKRDRFLAKVAVEIAKRTDFELGLDTATRFLEDQAPYDAGPAAVWLKNSTLH